MNVCCLCRVEMRCVKNGVRCVFGTDHVYTGDRFACPVCSAEFVHCNNTPRYYKDVLEREHPSRIVRMKEGE